MALKDFVRFISSDNDIINHQEILNNPNCMSVTENNNPGTKTLSRGCC